jgi:hypothetical protein
VETHRRQMAFYLSKSLIVIELTQWIGGGSKPWGRRDCKSLRSNDLHESEVVEAAGVERRWTPSCQQLGLIRLALIARIAQSAG